MSTYIYRKTLLRFAAALFDAVTGIAAFVSWVFRRHRLRPPKLIPERPRVAFLRLDGIGDVVASFEAVRAVKAKFPDGQVTMLVQEHIAELVRLLSFVDDVIPVNFNLYSGEVGIIKSLRYVTRLRKLLSGGCFDMGIDPRGDPRVIYTMWTCRVPYTVGARAAGAGHLLTISCDYTRTVPEARHNLSVVATIGAPRVPEPLSPPDVTSEWESLRSRFPQLSTPFFAVHPSATMQTRMWPAERFASCCEFIAERWRLLPVIVGAGDTEEQARRLKETANVELLDLVGETTMKELVALLAHSQLFVGNNSGPGHLAAFSGCPTVMVFGGANDPDVWKPPGEHVVAIYRKLDCSPCELRTCPEPRCLYEIEVEEVLVAVESLLG